jgi:hypothetical protein
MRIPKQPVTNRRVPLLGPPRTDLRLRTARFAIREQASPLVQQTQWMSVGVSEGKK